MERKAKKGYVFICIRKAFVIRMENRTLVEQPSAIYYSNTIGRRKNYRQSYPIPGSVGMRLKTFKTRKGAQDLVDFTNDVYGDKFVVEEISEQLAKACKV